MAKRCVIVAAGGSGGHLYPARGYAEALMTACPDWRVVLAADSRVLSRFLRHHGAFSDVRQIPAVPFEGMTSVMSLRFWGQLKDGFLQSVALIREEDPFLVIGFGGYGSFPAVTAAIAERRRTCVHEQNARAGLANRLLMPWVSSIADSFQSVNPSARRLWTGFPLRKNLKRVKKKEAAEKLGLTDQKKTLLIFGGSQGALFLNRLFFTFLNRYDDELKDEWQAVLIAGESSPGVPSAVPRFQTQTKVLFYTEDIADWYNAADLVVCRAGSSTMHELAFFEKDAVFVPYPGAKAHQAENALYAVKRDGARMVEQGQIDAQALRVFLAEAILKPEEAAGRGRRLGKAMKTDGAAALVKMTLEAAGREMVSQTGDSCAAAAGLGVDS